MNIKEDTIELGDISLKVIRKKIKNVHLSVHPPVGRVTISAPASMELETIRLFSISKLGWIRKQQLRHKNQKRETEREYVNRESHYYLGQRYLLKIVESNIQAKVVLKHNSIELHVRPNASQKHKEELLKSWYRQQLRELVEKQIPKHEKRMNIKVSDLLIRAMKTKWGSCNIQAKRILLNTELIKKPIETIDYVLVHEMVHLLERNHNEKFIAYMDKFSPKWKQLRQDLNSSTLGHIEWSY